MKKRELVLIAALIVFGVVYQAVEKGRVRFSKDFSFFGDDRRLKGTRFAEFPGREMQFPGVSRVTIENPAGEVAVGRSEDGLVHLASVVRIYHSGAGVPSASGRETEVRADMADGELKVSVRAPAPFPFQRQRILLRLRVPAEAALSIANHEGDVIVREAGKEVRIDQENGDVVLENIVAGSRLSLRNGAARMRGLGGHAEITAAHAKVSLDGAASLRLDGRHGEFTVRNVKGDAVMELAYSRLSLDGAGRLEIDARHTPIAARNIPGGATVVDKYETILLEGVGGDVRVSSRSGRVDLRRTAAGSVVLENAYADIVVSDFSGASLDVLLKNGNLDLGTARVSERVNVKAQYAELKLAFASLAEPTISIKAVHGRIFASPGLGLESYDENDESFANRAGQKPEILVHNTYGNVRVSAAD